MTVLREAKKLVGIDVSATMLFDHPTISSIAAYLAGMLAPQPEPLAPQPEPEEDHADLTLGSTSSVLDALFDSVESASAGRESGV
jgi:phthiocerol/phenolphthiocerol synthesis type-I polyketide synthase D